MLHFHPSQNRFVNGAKDVAEIIGHLVGLIPGK